MKDKTELELILEKLNMFKEQELTNIQSKVEQFRKVTSLVGNLEFSVKDMEKKIESVIQDVEKCLEDTSES